MRSILHASGYRFRLHRRTLPSKRGIVLPKCNPVIQLYGCLRHQHARLRVEYSLKSRIEFWCDKLTRNEKHNSGNFASLVLLGWRALLVREWQSIYPEQLANYLSEFLNRASLSPEIGMNKGVLL